MFYYFCCNLLKPVLRLIFHVKYKGRENIPDNGKLIVCSNHKSIVDPIILAIPFKRQIRYMAKSELFEDHGKIASWVLYKLGAFPVRRNKVDRTSIKTALSILNDEKVIGIFPQGKCVFNNEPFKPKAGAALIAYRGKSPVLPVSIYCNGVIKPFSHITITYGKPILYNELFNNKDKKSFRHAAKIIADKINSMLEAEGENKGC